MNIKLTEANLTQEVVCERFIDLKNGDRICIVTNIIVSWRWLIHILYLDAVMADKELAR